MCDGSLKTRVKFYRIFQAIVLLERSQNPSPPTRQYFSLCSLAVYRYNYLQAFNFFYLVFCFLGHFIHLLVENYWYELENVLLSDRKRGP